MLASALPDASSSSAVRDRERERERKMVMTLPGLFLFLKGMTGVLAPFSYPVHNNDTQQNRKTVY
jgi:hypothetical protein